MKRTSLFVSFVAAFLAAVPLQAAVVAVQNPSFESPLVTQNGGFYQTGTPDSWTATNFVAQYFERSDNGGFTGQPGITGANSQYLADDIAGGAVGLLTQDLGIQFLPNTSYSVDLAGGHRTNFLGASMLFGLRSSTNTSADLAGATIGFLDENSLANSTFVFASAAGANGGVFTFTTGASAPPGNIVAFISNAVNGSQTRLHADSFTATATAVPEPAGLSIMALGLVSLLAVRRRTRG